MELDEEYDDDNPLGIGTSNLSLLQRNGLSGIRPLTIADLLSTKPLKFLEGKQLQEEEIPHTAINARPQPLVSFWFLSNLKSFFPLDGPWINARLFSLLFIFFLQIFSSSFSIEIYNTFWNNF